MFVFVLFFQVFFFLLSSHKILFFLVIPSYFFFLHFHVMTRVWQRISSLTAQSGEKLAVYIQCLKDQTIDLPPNQELSPLVMKRSSRRGGPEPRLPVGLQINPNLKWSSYILSIAEDSGEIVGFLYRSLLLPSSISTIAGSGRKC